MIDLSGLKAPGWQRVVAELLTPAPDDRTFLLKLVAVLAQTAGARQAVLFALDLDAAGDAAAPAGAGDPRPVLIWPPSQAAGQTPAIEQASQARAAARAAAESGQLRVFGLEDGSGFYGEQDRGAVIAVPVEHRVSTPGETPPPGPRGVVTLVVEPRSKSAMQSTVAMVEVLCGYTQLHATRQQLRRTRAGTAALDMAARLIAAINGARGFKGACMQLVNDLQRAVRADRVALGWVRSIGGGGAVRVEAISDTEHVDRRMALVQKLQAAMDECLDQEHAVLYPPPSSVSVAARAEGDPGTQGAAPAASVDPLIAQSVTHAHRELASSDARLKVVSVPLRDGDRVVGVVTLESTAEGPADLASVELTQASLDLVTPVLRLRESDDRPLYRRAWASTVRGGEWLVGTTHTAWKLGGLAVLLLTLFVTFFRMEYRVEAPAEIQPRTRAVVAAPFDGVILSLPEGMAPGRRVARGEVLVQLDTREIQLAILEARSRQIQAMKEADAALKAGNRQSEVQQAQARAAQAEASLRRAEMQLEQARIVAPMDGTIIAGDLDDKVGAAVRLGDPLLQIAPLDDMLVIARLSDRDIELVRDELAEKGPSRGAVATRAAPATRHALTVERIVPLAQARDGKNAFEIRARLDQPVPGLKPGMEAVARFDTGRRSLLDIGTRRLRDQLRLWLWW